MKHLEFFKRFEALGINYQTMMALNNEEIEQIDIEDDEDLLLAGLIKNQTQEQKAQRDFDVQTLLVEDRPKSSYKLKIKQSETNKFRNTTTGFGFRSTLRDSSRESSATRDRNPMAESTMSFLKSVFNNNNQPGDEENFYS